MPGTRQSQAKTAAATVGAFRLEGAPDDGAPNSPHEHDASGASPVNDEIKEEVDRLSLDQALVDVEIANARVIDLTQRLLESRQEIAILQSQVERLQTEFQELNVRHEEMRSSTAFRLATKVWMIRNALGI